MPSKKGSSAQSIYLLVVFPTSHTTRLPSPSYPRVLVRIHFWPVCMCVCLSQGWGRTAGQDDSSPPRSTQVWARVRQVGSGGAAVVRAVTIETWTQKVGRLPPSHVCPPLSLTQWRLLSPISHHDSLLHAHMANTPQIQWGKQRGHKTYNFGLHNFYEQSLPLVPISFLANMTTLPLTTWWDTHHLIHSLLLRRD